MNLKVIKILPDPDLHYGIAPDEEGHTIQKAPQRPRKARHGPQTQSECLDTTDSLSEPYWASSKAPASGESETLERGNNG